MSTASYIPFFGRAWALTITPNNGPGANIPIVISSDSFEPEALRVEFEINQMAFSAFWQAEFIIYNADGPISSGPSEGIDLYNAVIQEGDMVEFRAGYQADYPNSIPPIIWKGPLFYTIQDRVDAVDKRLIIVSLISRALTTQNFLNETLPMRSTQFTQARFIADHSKIPIQINEDEFMQVFSTVTESRGADQLPRAKTYFGNPHNYLTAIADQNSLVSWIDQTTWHMDSLQVPLGELVATYGPIQLLDGPPRRDGKLSLTLINQPKQTNFGVDFRILLDPAVQVKFPLVQVGVLQETVRQFQIPYPPQKGQFMIEELSDRYVVVGVKIIGDTRGNPWYTDIIGVTQVISAVQFIGWSKSDHSAN